MCTCLQEPPPHPRAALCRFDSDGNGNLDSTEFLAMLHLLGSTMTTDEVAALVGRLDASGDGNLDAAELLGWFRSADFNSTPLSYSLLAFLADGRRPVLSPSRLKADYSPLEEQEMATSRLWRLAR